MKNFTKQNFKTNPLWIRLLIMTFMLLIGTSGAWAKYNQPAVDLYFDNSEAQWDNCRVYIGHDKWLAFYNMSRVSGTEHLWKLSSDFNSGNSWNDATHWGFTSDYWEAKEQSVIKIVYTGDEKFTYDNTNTVDENAWTNDKIYKTNGTANVTLDNQTKKAYKITSLTKSNYTVTINSETGGTLTVNDYDNNTVSNGASKIYLTVLKFSASALDGYTLEEVQIYDGSTTTTISAADLASTTYTLKSAVTITPAWKKTCTPPDAPELTNPDAQCGRSITLPATYNEFTLKWYDENGSVVNNTTITSSGTYYAATVGECESIERTRYIITINPVPSFTTEPSSVTLCSSATAISVEKLIVETGAKADNSATIELYDANNNKVTGDINISTASQTEYKLKASTTTCSSEDKTFTLTIKATPTPPTIEPTSVEICPNGQVTITATGDVNTQKYQLYKKVSETEYNKKGSEQTDNIFTITEAGYYKVKGINRECRSEYSDRIEITEITAPEAPSIEIGKANICAGVEETYILVKEPQEGYTYTLFNNGTEVNGATLNTENKFIISEAGNYTVKVTAPTERCSLTSAASEEKTLTVTSVSLALDPTSAPICSGKTIADIANYVKATATVTPSGAATISWYATEKATVALTNATVLEAKTYYAEAATQSGCKSDRKAFEVTSLMTAPSAPVITPSNETICSGNTVTLTLGTKVEGETYEIENTPVFESSNTYTTPTIDNDANYTVVATNSCGSTNSNEVSITVNPLPEIGSISGATSAVKYEDVELRANGVTEGTTVKWYEGGEEKGEGLTYVVTSETATSKVVTAKAFLNGCESAEVSKKVTFDVEDCTPTTTTTSKPVPDVKKVEIWCRGINGTKSADIKCYAWSGSINMFGSYPGTKTTTSDKYNNQTYYIWTYEFTGSQTDIKAIFNTDGNNDKTGDISIGNSGYRYYYTYDKSKKTATQEKKVEITKTETTTTTTPAPITAPAVKITSAAYNENTGKIDASGAVYKTGCGETFWGFQYSADGQKWGTADADFIRPSSGNSLSEPGVFAHSFEIPNANGGDIYYIRAYAINNYNKDSYSLNSAVFSETKIPVEIPSSTIESATISLVDSEGKDSDVTKVCPQSTVYLRVDYTGGDYKEFEATENFPGTNLVEVTRNKLDNYAIFSFTATSAGTANITISNNNSSVTPATGVAITLNDVETITTPVISMDPASGMICSDGEATITIYEPNANYTYALYKDSELADDESKGSYTVNEAGSYTVIATESVCGTSASSMAIELKVVSSDVKINLVADPTTTSPWQPIKLTVTPPAGYDYTLEGINDVEYTQNGDVYTVKIPRPETWPAGNSGTGKDLKTADKTFTAKIKVSDTTSCGSKSVTVKLTDTEENCQ